MVKEQTESEQEVKEEDRAKKKLARPKKQVAESAPNEPAKQKRVKKTHKKVGRKSLVARGKRKESIARATITTGKGAITINKMNIASINNKYVQEIVREPLRYVGPEANNINIAVNVNGGGAMGQAQAARTAIANALVMYFENMNLKDKFSEIDRSLIVEDTRRVEPKKFRGPKARARFQKSYR